MSKIIRSIGAGLLSGSVALLVIVWLVAVVFFMHVSPPISLLLFCLGVGTVIGVAYYFEFLT